MTDYNTVVKYLQLACMKQNKENQEQCKFHESVSKFTEWMAFLVTGFLIVNETKECLVYFTTQLQLVHWTTVPRN